MADARDIIDLLIDRFIGDLHFPLMTRAAWQVKLRPLLPPINNILDEVKHEARTDLIREITPD